MAVASKTDVQSCGNLGCGHVNAQCNATLRIDTFTSNGLQSNGKIKYTATCSGTWSFSTSIVWANNTPFANSMSMGGQSTSWTTAKGCNTACPSGQGSCCNCNGITYTTGTKTFTFELSPTTTSVTCSWTYNGNNTSVSYTIPESMRIVAPSGFSMSCPSYLGGTAYLSVSKWGDPNGGKFTLKTLNSSGSVVSSTSYSTTSTGAYITMPGSYSKNTRYSLSATACNTANMCVSTSGCNIYSRPPCPTVTIMSCIYNPSTQKCSLHFKWSKASDAGTYSETISYTVTDNDGRSYASGTLATATGGASKSGEKTLTNIETAVNVTVNVTCSSTAGSCTGSASVYSPVAGAAFLGFNWDDLRRTCTILGTAPGAKQTRISAGYSPNNYNVGTKVTAGEYGDLVVKDLAHGNGEILYLEAMPEATDNHKYIDEVAKISIPIPNPILGIWSPSCEQVAAGVEKKYIVDIIEKKKDANACTPRWQVGDRVVKIAPCNPAQPGHDALPSCGECGPGLDCGGGSSEAEPEDTNVEVTTPANNATYTTLTTANPFGGKMKVLADGWVRFTYNKPNKTIEKNTIHSFDYTGMCIFFPVEVPGRLSMDFSWLKPGKKYEIKLEFRDGEIITGSDVVGFWVLRMTDVMPRAHGGRTFFDVPLYWDGRPSVIDLTNITSLAPDCIQWVYAQLFTYDGEQFSGLMSGVSGTTGTGFDFRVVYREIG